MRGKNALKEIERLHTLPPEEKLPALDAHAFNGALKADAVKKQVKRNSTIYGFEFSSGPASCSFQYITGLSWYGNAEVEEELYLRLKDYQGYRGILEAHLGYTQVEKTAPILKRAGFYKAYEYNGVHNTPVTVYRWAHPHTGLTNDPAIAPK